MQSGISCTARYIRTIDRPSFTLRCSRFTYPTPPSPDETAVGTASGFVASLDSKAETTALRPTKSGFRPINTINRTLSKKVALLLLTLLYALDRLAATPAQAAVQGLTRCLLVLGLMQSFGIVSVSKNDTLMSDY